MSARFNIADIVRQRLPAAGELARRVQLGIMAAWAAEARSGLGRSDKTVSAYVGGLQPSTTSMAGVELLGTFPNMFEQGMGPGGVGTEGGYDNICIEISRRCGDIESRAEYARAVISRAY